MENLIRITRIETIRLALIGLICALLMLILMTGSEIFNFLMNLLPNILLGIFGLFLGSWLIAGWAGRLLYKKMLSPYLLGFLITILSLEFGTLCGSLFGYFEEGINSDNGIADYIFKPLFGILFWGSIPIVILSVILGVRLAYKAK
jgi:hypothetical protein